MALNEMLAIHPDYDEAHARGLYRRLWNDLVKAEVMNPKQVQADLMTWRRGSAQIALRINSSLNNLTIYSVLVANVNPSVKLYQNLLAYNYLQRPECLGMLNQEGQWYIILKYTMELEIVSDDVLQRHVFQIQERADKLDTELAAEFGGSLHFEDWDTVGQNEIDSLFDNLTG